MDSENAEDMLCYPIESAISILDRTVIILKRKSIADEETFSVTLSRRTAIGSKDNPCCTIWEVVCSFNGTGGT